MQIINSKGDKSTISRSGTISVKTKRNSDVKVLQFKHLDATISSEVGKNVLHKRSEEISGLSCQLLGVSRAVINLVLFCHQEEADWPLGTDTMVKERFDKIFGTDGIMKLLEKLRVIVKDRTANSKCLSKQKMLFALIVYFEYNYECVAFR